MTTILTKEKWQARRPTSPMRRVDPASRVYAFLHYSTGEELGNPDIPQWLRNIQRYHQETNGWSDIGYNLAISNDGRVWEGRGWDFAGAHCPDFNVLGYGFVFLGDDDPGVVDISMKAKIAIRDVFTEADGRSGRQLIRLGHRDRRATACPGDELYAWLRAGCPVDVRVPMPPPNNRRQPARPAFPLPDGHWFGPPSPDARNHSGYYSRTDRHHLAQWEAQMRKRGWRIAVNGFHDGETNGVAARFAQEKKLRVHRPGVINRAVWNAAWTTPVTK